ncbi:lasso peptide biosynthesis B2 protein [Novosphingobium aquimarinum]|uniref:lasso peptide biosynthesis B2 protein n=1 Tax=Novosphingobium aquimarinum TaxID=2682494 RepID=UPI0012EBB0F4|nr:lasso peptide biosynthesis B2 protein [Novosphingobium aquimarinum]
MNLRVKPGLHFCTVEGRTIFLDEGKSRYFCIPADVDRAFQHTILANGKLDDGPDTALITDLISLEIIDGENAEGSGLTSPPSVAEPNEDLTAYSAHVAPAVEIAAAVFERLRSKEIATRRHIADVRCLIERERLRFAHRHSGCNPASNLGLSAAFEVSDFVFGRNDRCLPRAIALIRRCLRLGHNAHLVIGVRINPFTAHCWVQQGSLVIGDSIDVARIYTPICVL